MFVRADLSPENVSGMIISSDDRSSDGGSFLTNVNVITLNANAAVHKIFL